MFSVEIGYKRKINSAELEELIRLADNNGSKSGGKINRDSSVVYSGIRVDFETSGEAADYIVELKRIDYVKSAYFAEVAQIY